MEKDTIKEISCNARNCVYNESGCKCNAGHIEVGTSTASKSSETCCSTFKACTNCDCNI